MTSPLGFLAAKAPFLSSRLRALQATAPAVATYWRARRVLHPFNPNWFASKRVAIIGGADSVLQRKNGAFIDGHDVVVRINNGVRCIPQQEDYIGKRTDFLVHSFYDAGDPGSSPVDPALWRRMSVGHVIFALNFFVGSYALRNVNKFLLDTEFKQPFSMPTRQVAKHISSLVRGGPTTGFSAIKMVERCNPSELFVTGFTFSFSNTNPAHRQLTPEYISQMSSRGDHDLGAELRHFRKMCRLNPRIRVDECLNQRLTSSGE